MKTLISILLVFVLIDFQATQAQTKVLHKIVDATEANKIYNEMGGASWNNKTNWPIPEDVKDQKPKPYGTNFIIVDTVQVNDTTIRYEYKVWSISLPYNNLTGELPSVTLDEIWYLNLSGNQIPTVNPSMNMPELEELYLAYNDLSSWGNPSLPSLQQLSLSSNSLSGQVTSYNCPMLEVLNLGGNQFTSVNASLNYPNLKHLDLGNNDLSGAIPEFQLSNLEFLSLSSNNFSGPMHNFSGTPNLKTLSVSLNDLSGQLPSSFGFDQSIETLYLGANDFTGNLPAYSFPNAKIFSVEGNELTGAVPVLEMPQLETLVLRYNFFSGSFPNLNMLNLTYMDVHDNNFSGQLPALNFPLLTWLDLADNNFEGPIPNLNMPELEYLRMRANKLSGPIPAFSLAKVTTINLAGNELTGAFPVLDCPNLTILDLDGNELSGEIASISIPTLQELSISDNNFIGDFPADELPNLRNLYISSNDFENLPNLLGSSPNLYLLWCSHNQFEFDDLLPYVGLGSFLYRYQDSVDMLAEPNMDGEVILITDVGGNGNQYKWFENGVEIQGETQTTLNIGKNKDPENFDCQITNPQLPNLTLYTRLVFPPGEQCWENDFFKICMLDEDEGWRPGDKQNEIQSQVPLVVNEFLFFEGTMIIDTSALSVHINGKFLLKDIALPGGGTGNFKLAEGEYELQLGGSEGVITGFLNNQLAQFVPEIGGLAIKIDDISLLGGKNAEGVSLSFTVEFDNITPSCGTSGAQTTSIAIQGLELRTGGISVNGLQVGDLGLAPGFCLKELGAAYDQDKDKLTFGLTLLTPFIEVGGGLGFIAGEIDSIAMKAVLQDAIIPIGATGVGVIGCEGRISSITNPPWNMRFGGIFSAVVSDDIFQLTTSVEYIPPAELKLEAGDGKFFNPPILDDWWQIEGGVYGSLDLRDYRMKIGGTIDLAPYMDGNDKNFIGNGALDMTYRNINKPVFMGQFRGMFTLPKLSSRFPFDWMSAKFGLPYSAGGNGFLLHKSGTATQFVMGDVNLGGRIGEVQYRLEYAKHYTDPDFFTFTIKEADVTSGLAEAFNYKFNIGENVDMAVVRISSIEALPVSNLKQPDGNILQESAPGSEAEVNKDAAEQKVFWTLYEPQQGEWEVNTDVNSTVDVFLFGARTTFELEAERIGDDIHLSWNPILFEMGDSLEFFADEDTLDYNGGYIASVDALDGEYTINPDQLEGFCEFYIHAFGATSSGVVVDYTEEAFTNILTTLPLPERVEVYYNPQTKTLELAWMPSDDPEVAGYMIELIEGGERTNIGMLYSDEHTYTYPLEEHTGQEVVFYSYSEDGVYSCPSAPYEIRTTAVDQPLEMELELLVYPNPTNDQARIRMYSSEVTEVDLLLYHLQGQRVMEMKAVQLYQGWNEQKLQFEGLMPGFYIFVVNGEKINASTQLIIQP